MTDRLEEIFSIIPKTKVFADIGCDHGYVSLKMLESGKCELAILSDISEKCLEKAKKAVYKYIINNRAKTFVSNGFDNLPQVDLALIAGMGGEEIISILKKAKNLPNELVLQPMKNTDKLRVFLLSIGYAFIRDYTFKAEGKFYDLMLLKKGKDCLSKEEILFGKDNIKNKGKDFIEKINILIENNRKILSNTSLSQETREEKEKEMERLVKCLN